MGKLSALRFVSVTCTIAIALLVSLCLLPHNRYLRFQSLTDPQVVKASWIFERIHFDPTPIDIVFIGTSHTVFGVNSAIVEQACRAAGGGHCRTVNFGMEHLGRDLHWLISREVLQSRRPRLLVIEVQEREPRAMHPAFPYLANAGDVVAAPLILNTAYFPNLTRLPLRQASLWARTITPTLFGARMIFDPKRYRGPHWDDTYAETGSPEHPIANASPRIAIHSAADLEFERAHPQSNEGVAFRLPGPLHALEYRATITYLDKLTTLARLKGIPVRFLYMPSYGSTESPEFSEYYQHAAPMWQMPKDVLLRPGLWLDVGHLNYAGATKFSHWLGNMVASDVR
jgi:hypothetical protein